MVIYAFFTDEACGIEVTRRTILRNSSFWRKTGKKLGKFGFLVHLEKDVEDILFGYFLKLNVFFLFKKKIIFPFF